MAALRKYMQNTAGVRKITRRYISQRSVMGSRPVYDLSRVDVELTRNGLTPTTEHVWLGALLFTSACELLSEAPFPKTLKGCGPCLSYENHAFVRMRLKHRLGTCRTKCFVTRPGPTRILRKYAYPARGRPAGRVGYGLSCRPAPLVVP